MSSSATTVTSGTVTSTIYMPSSAGFDVAANVRDRRHWHYPVGLPISSFAARMAKTSIPAPRPSQ